MRWIQTNSGKKFEFPIPRADQIDIKDIAHALANTCRFGGQSNAIYTVAQHSVHVSEYVSQEYALQGLMHDAAEAYIGDLPSPLKRLLPAYQKIESTILALIFNKFGIEFPVSDEVKKWDRILCLSERNALFDDSIAWGWEEEASLPEIEITPWFPPKAKALFLARYRNLIRSVG